MNRILLGKPTSGIICQRIYLTIPNSASVLRNSGLVHRPLIRRSTMTSTVDWKPIKTHNNPNDNSKRKKSSMGKKIALGLMIAMPVISFYLGTWQLRRLSWKTKLIAQCETKLTYEPIKLPKVFTVDMCEDWEYRKVIIEGKYVHEEEMFVGPRARNGEKGYVLFTPFIRSDTGEKILIERGWISESNVAPQNRTLHHLSMPITNEDIKLICFVRPPKVRGKLQWEKTDRESRLWQVPDIYDMAESCGCKPINFQVMYDMRDHPEWLPRENNMESQSGSRSTVGSFFQKIVPLGLFKQNASESLKDHASEENLDEIMEFSEWQFMKAGVPIGKKPTIDLRNNHLQYLVTWYGLSLLSTIFLIVALRKYWWTGNVVSQSQLKKEKLKHAQKYM